MPFFLTIFGTCEKLLGITIDSDYIFEEHIEKLAKNCLRYLEFHNIYITQKANIIQSFYNATVQLLSINTAEV